LFVISGGLKKIQDGGVSKVASKIDGLKIRVEWGKNPVFSHSSRTYIHTYIPSSISCMYLIILELSRLDDWVGLFLLLV
jgi:hypothetical protein